MNCKPFASPFFNFSRNSINNRPITFTPTRAPSVISVAPQKSFWRTFFSTIGMSRLKEAGSQTFGGSAQALHADTSA